MRILLTNDDGIGATGLVALDEAVRAHGQWSVTTVAPREERSAVSQGFTLHRTYEVEQIGEAVYAVDGTPVDCVMFATTALGPFDLVVSGINRGANLGWDCWYSGTVGAACEAVRRGYPALAVSLDMVGTAPPYYFGDAAEATVFHLEAFVTEVGHYPRPATEVLNLNFPNRPQQEWQPLRVCSTGQYVVNQNHLRVQQHGKDRWSVRVEQSRVDSCRPDDAENSDGAMVRHGPVLTRLPLAWGRVIGPTVTSHGVAEDVALWPSDHSLGSTPSTEVSPESVTTLANQDSSSNDGLEGRGPWRQ
jgi:5'-nucleotidase